MCQLSNGAGESDSKTKVVGGDSIAGQIASFMENLHLSYTEIYEGIPYILLLAMSADKPRAVYEDKDKPEVIKMPGKDVLKAKRSI